MTVAETRRRPATSPRLSPSHTAQTWAMSKRSVLALWRQPSLVIPSLIFPLFFAALGTSSFSRATSLPGFPEVDSYLDFALAGAVVQGQRYLAGDLDLELVAIARRTTEMEYEALRLIEAGPTDWRKG